MNLDNTADLESKGGRFDSNMNDPSCSLIIGTWQAGLDYWEGIQPDQIDQALDKAYQKGVRYFDTAPVYGNGRAERVLGRALARWSESCRVYSKVSPFNLSCDDVKRSCEGTLSRLGCTSVTGLMVHWPAGSYGSEDVPIAQTMQGLNDLKEQGVIQEIGLSNVSLSQLKEAQKEGRVDFVQLPFSLLWPHIRHDILPYCQSHNITVQAYSPLAQGLLTGQYKGGEKMAPKDHRRRNLLFKPHLAKHVDRVLMALSEMATASNCHISNLALQWLRAQQGVVPVVGVRAPDQVGVHLMTSRMSDEIQARMSQLSDEFRHYLDQNRVQWR